MKKTLSFFIIILFILSFSGCSYQNEYGNSEKQILNYLKTSDLLPEVDKSNVHIIDYIYSDNYKIVGFTSTTVNGFLLYNKDNYDNYLLEYGKTSIIDNTIPHLSIIDAYNKDDNSRSFLLISEENQAAKVKIIINGQHEIYRDIPLDTKSMILIKEELEINEEKSFTLEVKFFDIHNNELI